MRHTGRLTEWNDDRGFGFINPAGGGERVFVHVRAFADRRRRPLGEETVTYELARDPRGRPRAANVAFTRDRAVRPSASRRRAGAPAWPVVFLLLVGVAAVAGLLPPLVPAVYLVASVVTWFAYALDKAAARRNRWRTPESTLHLLSLLGGWPGALVAQRSLRHKSSKSTFQARYWGTVLLNCGALAWYLTAAALAGA